MRSGKFGFLGSFDAAAPAISMIALPLTYDEGDSEGVMTWVRQGNGPHVTPMGFEGDGYEARLKSTTIPAWMTSASAALTLHASIRFYPQQLRSTSEFVVYAGEDDATPFSKMGISVVPDATNSQITQLVYRLGTGGTGFVEKRMGRSGWKFETLSPDITVGGYQVRPQALLFLDADTVIMTGHFEDTFTRVWKVRLSDFAVLDYFDATGDWVHIGVMAQRSNGDVYAGSAANKICKVDLDASFLAGTISFSNVIDCSTLFTEGIGGLEFVTVGGTEYMILPEYRYASGTPYFYVFNASTALALSSLSATDRYKRFLGIPRESQGCCMRSGLLVTVTNDGGVAGTSRYGYVKTWDIVTAISSSSDGATISATATFDAASKYTEDVAAHPGTNDLWMGTEGITAVGSDVGGLSWWSSKLDGALVENHYTIEYDGAGLSTIKVNNRLYDTVSGTCAIAVDCVTVGGTPAAAAGITARYFTGFVRNVVLQDQPMTTAQYNAAVNGDYEPNSLTAYEFTLTNPGAESGNTSGWTVESGGMVALQYPSTTGTLPHSGNWLFSGGNNATSISRQRLDVLAQTGLSGAAVDAGGMWAKVRWWQTNADTVDSGAMGLRLLDVSQVQISIAYAGIATMPNVSGSYRPWYPRTLAADLSSGSRYVDALTRHVRASGTVNDAQIDDVRVTVYQQ
ncbi:hypothetical protein QQF45_16550 [Halopseudomonas aestusnigri]|uniref:hypothetical protein n=1 Tax=Halopseudomonas aestusnigri TaxID=857252 RepID=UPI0025562C2E|nr:hypothetical protein [Halopseudomonas aestusnigri]MDL2200655.1 hypothetical protein [Halopseudomonas aestusnigri]